MADETKNKVTSKELNIIANLTLMDDIFMSAVFGNSVACTQEVLRIIMDVPDLVVTQVQAQTTLHNLAHRSVRLDVMGVDSNGKIYDIEIQRSNTGAIAKRARYNSAMMDSNATSQGQKLDELPETYVIFITENDVLKGNLGIYHIDRIIRETGQPFDDKAHIIYVNGEYSADDNIGNLMRDMHCKTAGNISNRIIANEISYYKNNEKGVDYMSESLRKYGDEREEKGEEKGEVKGVIKGWLISIKTAIRMNLAPGEFIKNMDIPEDVKGDLAYIVETGRDNDESCIQEFINKHHDTLNA